MTENEHAVFGYGSLINPVSAVSRFADLPPIDPVYEAGLTRGDAGLIREQALDEWERRKSDFTLYPVKVNGFCRTYTYDSPRGGAMLEATYTGDEADMMNGLLIVGYTESEYEEITASEVGYDVITLSENDFESYTDDNVVSPHPISVYVQPDDSPSRTTRFRNPTYHARIIAGIEMLDELFGPDVKERFWTDFIASTYEISIPNSSSTQSQWLNTVAENDASVRGFSRLFGVAEK